MGTTETRDAGLLVGVKEEWPPRPFFRNGLFSEIGRIGPQWILALRGQNPPAPVFVMAEPTPEEYETGQKVVEAGE